MVINLGKYLWLTTKRQDLFKSMLFIDSRLNYGNAASLAIQNGAKMRLSEDAKSQKWLSTLGNIQGYALQDTNLLNSMLFVDISLSYRKAASGSYSNDIKSGANMVINLEKYLWLCIGTYKIVKLFEKVIKQFISMEN